MLVDASSGKIIRHSEQKKPADSLDDILNKEKSREKDPDKKFGAVMGEMKKRKEELNREFNEAKEKAAKEPTEPKPDPFRWD